MDKNDLKKIFEKIAELQKAIEDFEKKYPEKKKKLIVKDSLQDNKLSSVDDFKKMIELMFEYFEDLEDEEDIKEYYRKKEAGTLKMKALEDVEKALGL
ncbi:MAG: hypothetical protein QT05_C0052G0010 [archaeon GW2011_AR13]|nr:MAG: hypothetical protein QT05_C0052G0010 [archaeon GW2011_AR13]HIG94244.1 hypothetical protein [Nanoarchaeota archaeon]HIH63143.1 hypothetical protein [Nanoarchaeota archaeon]HIJ10408.1 hypothetical protein [Nanoarchaeota archaeon]